MTLPLPIRTAGDTAAEHVDDHNEIHGILGGGLPTGLTTAGTGHLANHNTIHTLLNSTEGQSLPTGIAAGATGHLSHHNTIHTVLNETEAPSSIYGPTAGAAAIRAGAVPQTVSDPGGATLFTSRADLVTKLAASPNGTFKSQAGTYTWSSQVTVSGSAKIYLLSGTIIDGANESATGITAFNLTGSGAEIHGGELKNLWRGIAMESSNQVIQDVTIHDCYEKAFNFGVGNNCRATRIYAHTNGKYNCSGSTTNPYVVGNILEYCHIANGNTRLLDAPPGTVDSGGTKFVRQDGMIVRYNWFEDNRGSGLWFDGAQKNVQVYDNVTENNDRWGIFYELGQGGTVIHHNACIDNANGTNDFGTGQLHTSGANATTAGNNSTIEIYNNYITGDGTQVQIGIMNHGGHGLAKGTYFHDNDVWDRGATAARSWGLVTTNGIVPLDPASLNRFENNRYHVKAGQTGATCFVWGESQSAVFTLAGFKAFGHEDTGTITGDA